MKPLLLLALPRSGGTLLMRVMNACDGVRIAGEPGRVPVMLCNLVEEGFFNPEDTGKTYEQIIEHEDTPANWRNYDRDKAMGSLRAFCRHYFNRDDAKLWGWKDIYTGRASFHLFRRQIEILKELIPGLQLAINLRALVEIKDSIQRQGWHYDLDGVDQHRLNLLRLAKEFDVVEFGYWRVAKNFDYTRSKLAKLGMELTKEAWQKVINLKTT